jgi:1,4-alpha-glucan branching enzyme
MVKQMPDGTVEFRLCRPGARQVTLAGDFNGWNETSFPMALGADGWWTYRLRLAPGCYQFRYLADREWHTDYAAFGLEHGPFGLNSVVKVEAAQRIRALPERAQTMRFPNSRKAQEDSIVPSYLTNNDWSVDETAEELAVAGV